VVDEETAYFGLDADEMDVQGLYDCLRELHKPAE
jgi:hypothetical protein